MKRPSSIKVLRLASKDHVVLLRLITKDSGVGCMRLKRTNYRSVILEFLLGFLRGFLDVAVESKTAERRQ